MRNYFVLLSLIAFLVSCTNKEKNLDDIVEKDTILVQNKKNINAIGMTLSPEAQEFVSDWTEYIQFDTFINRYYAISNAEALHNAKDLSKMATTLKDSTNFVILQEESTLARFNILDNECKRLADMSTIKAITPAEVSLQIKNVLEAFSAINSKLNSVISLINMESELQLDPDFKAILSQIPEAERKINPIPPSNPITPPNEKRLFPAPVIKKTETPTLDLKKNLKEKIKKSSNQEIFAQ